MSKAQDWSGGDQMDFFGNWKNGVVKLRSSQN